MRGLTILRTGIILRSPRRRTPERDLEDLICADPSVLHQIGIDPTPRSFRRQARIPKYGHTKTARRVDLRCRTKDGSIVLIELKAGCAGLRALQQIEDYVNATRRRHRDTPVRGVLISADCDDTFASALPDTDGIEHATWSMQDDLLVLRDQAKSSAREPRPTKADR